MTERLLLLVLVSLPTISSYAQTITLDDFLQQLQIDHPLFVREGLTAQIEEAEQASYLGAEDWQLFSQAAFQHQEPALALAGPEQTDALLIDGGVERLFWKTGGRLSGSLTLSRAKVRIAPIYQFPESFYQNRLAVTYSHPLWQNRHGFLDRLPYELHQYEIDFAEVQALENREEFLATTAGKFLEWVFLTEQRNIVQNRLALAEEELARTQRKREANLIDEVDVIRAEDAVRIARQGLVQAESGWSSLQAELAELSQRPELYEQAPVYNLYAIHTIPTIEQSSSQLQEQSRLLAALDLHRQQMRFLRRGNEETLKSSLNLFGQLSLEQMDENLGSSLVLDKPDAIVGIQYSFPLEKRTAKARISKVDLQIQQLDEQIKEVTLGLTSALAGLTVQINETARILQLNLEQISSAENRTAEELRIYNQGRGELTFVIQSRDSEQNARLSYAANALLYQQLVLAYRALMDEIY
ncbi:TolC family protein [bacterium]|nr:TolC family protein [bacterium]